jgi:hypothetical protein
MDERLYTEMTPFGSWRLKQAWRSFSSAVQHLMELLEGERIRGKLRTRTVDGAVRSPLVILNKTFRPRHNFSKFSKPLSGRR